MVFTYTRLALKPTADLIHGIETLIQGDVVSPYSVEQKLAARFRLLGPQGLVGMALAAIDMALWDALARLHECSLVHLLGGVEAPVRAYGAIGYDGEPRSAAVAERWAKKGFTGVKAKIGCPTVAEDIAVVRAIRSAVGPDVAIIIDYNQSLSPVEAISRVERLDDEGLEEPTLAHDYAGHAAVAAAVRTPIQAGENWWGTTDLLHALSAHASDLVMPDVMKIGGVSGWLRAAALAHAHHIPVKVPSTPKAPQGQAWIGTRQPSRVCEAPRVTAFVGAFHLGGVVGPRAAVHMRVPAACKVHQPLIVR